MKILKRTQESELKDAFINKALSYVGYQALGNRDNAFGKRLNINGLPWDGAFIEVTARETGLTASALPVMTFTTVALGQFISRERVYRIPQRGDIMFFETSTDGDFGMPHVGIVIDVGPNGLLLTVEGMTASGMPRRADVADGVYQRTRHVSEAIGFGRPNFKSASHREQESLTDALFTNLPSVSLAQVRNGSKHRNVELLQHALHACTGVDGYVRGKFDERTRLAYAKFQRLIGYPASASTGVVDEVSLRKLSELSRVFNLI